MYFQISTVPENKILAKNSEFTGSFQEDVEIVLT